MTNNVSVNYTDKDAKIVLAINDKTNEKVKTPETPTTPVVPNQSVIQNKPFKALRVFKVLGSFFWVVYAILWFVLGYAAIPNDTLLVISMQTAKGLMYGMVVTGVLGIIFSGVFLGLLVKYKTHITKAFVFNLIYCLAILFIFVCGMVYIVNYYLCAAGDFSLWNQLMAIPNNGYTDIYYANAALCIYVAITSLTSVFRK